MVHSTTEYYKKGDGLEREKESLMSENKTMESKLEEIKIIAVGKEQEKESSIGVINNLKLEIEELEKRKESLKEETANASEELRKVKGEMQKEEEVFRTLGHSIKTYIDLKNETTEKRK